jgi:AcrR family transcriptional regulator
VPAKPPDPALRERILEAAYACFARFGLGKTTVEDVVKESGVSRATIYRTFPGGKDQLLREVVAWEMGRFFGALAEAVVGAPDFASLVEDGLVFAHRAVGEHIVLQKILVTEPERLLPLLTTEQHRPLTFITGYLVPFLEREERAGRLQPGLDQARAADFVARMLLSLIGSSGRELEDPVERRRLVRDQLLVGVLTPEALAAP